jgi:hypothetical protein
MPNMHKFSPIVRMLHRGADPGRQHPKTQFIMPGVCKSSESRDRCRRSRDKAIIQNTYLVSAKFLIEFIDHYHRSISFSDIYILKKSFSLLQYGQGAFIFTVFCCIWRRKWITWEHFWKRLCIFHLSPGPGFARGAKGAEFNRPVPHFSAKYHM